MDAAVMQKHIDLYVNEFSVDMGAIGRNAVNQMFAYAKSAGIIAVMPGHIYFSESQC
jgi:1,4-dihydroxy-6-naphthoate synthase